MGLAVVILGGGSGTRLFPLTKYRSKPAVPLAGNYRLIDVPLSNCINSGLNRIYVLTQFLSVSLHRHIRQTYRFDHFNAGFVELLAAQQTYDPGKDWYQGTADAVRKNLRYLHEPWIEHVLILSGDQLYRMDYRDMVRTHREANADVSIAAMPVPRSAAAGLGVMRCNADGRVEGFLEKPQSDEEIDLVRTDPEWMQSRGIASQGRDCLASMGIYLFNRQTLIDVLEKTDYEDFGKEVFPAAIRSRHVQAHLFDGYWEDIGTVKSFYDANLALAQPLPPFDIASATAPLYTRARFLPPAHIDGARIYRSLIGNGCVIQSGAIIENSVIGLRCRIGSNVTIRNSVLMGADEYELPANVSGMPSPRPTLGIGDGSTIDGAIVDKNARIGRQVQITNRDRLQDLDIDEQCYIRDGIVVVAKDATVNDGWTMEEARQDVN